MSVFYCSKCDNVVAKNTSGILVKALEKKNRNEKTFVLKRDNA